MQLHIYSIQPVFSTSHFPSLKNFVARVVNLPCPLDAKPGAHELLDRKILQSQLGASDSFVVVTWLVPTLEPSHHPQDQLDPFSSSGSRSAHQHGAATTPSERRASPWARSAIPLTGADLRARLSSLA